VVINLYDEADPTRLVEMILLEDDFIPTGNMVDYGGLFEFKNVVGDFRVEVRLCVANTLNLLDSDTGTIRVQ